MVLDKALSEGAVPDGFREVDVKFFQFKQIGDSVTGKLLSTTILKMSRGNKCGKYKVQLKDGSLVSFLGSIELDDKMAVIPAGSTIFVEFKGAERIAGTQNDIKHFRVYVK